ncbi:helix-turn-helix domain-containing protein [Streptomyces sp. NPDC059166]|uniref:helix-turn-helix domain-containing protein n=1 Tax=Streptomyces sp. NPDC059166 TaxID=3346752 RepID=UPI00367B5ED8
MPHRNAPLTETGRLRLALCVVHDGWPLRRAAERFQVSATTAKRWADRYREQGEAGTHDRSCRIATAPHPDPFRKEDHQGAGPAPLGPARIGYLLGVNPATVHRMLARYRLARLAHLRAFPKAVLRPAVTGHRWTSRWQADRR